MNVAGVEKVVFLLLLVCSSLKLLDLFDNKRPKTSADRMILYFGLINLDMPLLKHNKKLLKILVGFGSKKTSLFALKS